jgi:hypothetical protein
MAEKPKIAMISGTSIDLAEHRRLVIDACRRLRITPLLMDSAAGGDAETIQASVEMVDQADIFIGIYAWRYGALSEMEYKRAVERKIPILIFVMHDEHPRTPQMVESDPRARKKLAAFKERVRKEHVVAIFRWPQELHAKVLQALTALLQRDAAASAEHPENAAVAAADDGPQAKSTPPPPAASDVSVSSGAAAPSPIAAPSGDHGSATVVGSGGVASVSAATSNGAAATDPLSLAWRLVVDFKSEPDLLLHLDPTRFREAIDKLQSELKFGSDTPWDQKKALANTHLETKHRGESPNALWTAWVNNLYAFKIRALNEISEPVDPSAVTIKGVLPTPASEAQSPPRTKRAVKKS